MKTRNQIAEIAHYKAVLILKFDALRNHRELFTELEHYFNKDMQEIACIFDPFGLELITKFEPPRIWDNAYFKEYKITSLKGD